ncbi:outer membrane beta-barrel protein [Aliivibrio fischeri]|uniref:Outer membrane beta-barrel protein n=1 Tax=Aliivibrio fischeri TaxID=668 RepID=A0A510UDZ6_ALIFS|nr:outer membrane beta-barrel protein [Aliivibrio fischeri]MUK48590.1 outer membrane beta-barrel protein [Aliivibrio fischeri]MUK65746.1 outer membrane beta-barrel protein [Aliivibrio fischeri]GEK12739.1 hypothetical protein AFI02nite_07750 [Aliivibrio fischeri]
MKRLSLLGLLILTPLPSLAQIHITPSVGYASGGEIEDTEGEIYDLKGNTAYSLAIETDYDAGRIGLFYSNQSNDIEGLNQTSNMHYLHFQSALDYQLTKNISSFFGLSIGGTYADVDWIDENIRFSAGAFGGFQYHFTDNFALQLEGRWLGTSVDSNFDSSCVSTPNKNSCTIKYEGSWVNQLQANLGLRFSF